MKRGFTLIELLIVIGILAIMATVVVLVLNPAEILAQARDSQRISDLGSVKSAIALYLATATATSTASSTNYGNPLGTNARVNVTAAANPFVTSNVTTVTSSAVNGTGWVNIKLDDTVGGSSLSALPPDPSNNTTYYYGYAGNSNAQTFELTGRLESAKYRPLMLNDGGDRNCPSNGTGDWNTTCYYEMGTQPNLNL